ncbi:MAG: hypothetical protein WCE87_04510 [Candidatus Udaeobacter sp.]
MKILTSIICAGLALTVLSACEKKEAFTQCATPTLTPPNGSGHAGQDIKVTIETKTLGASLSWSDDPSQPPTPTGPHIINGPKGDAITVYGRTLRAMAFKTGMQDSPVVEGVYSANQ